jgi:glycerate kinase
VPAHAIVGENAIDRFDARILDLQVILEASSVGELADAGRRLMQAL